MRKQTKVAVVVSAAALLAMGASMTSFAKGWDLVDNEWVYLDSDGDPVTDEWKKSVDGNYYYLDEDGVMATNRLVEEDDGDIYYVNGEGVRITNDWVAVDNEEGDSVNDIEVDTLWYYFKADGKAVKAADSGSVKKRTIGGHTYFFDDEGRMMSGRVNDGEKVYYCGTEDQGYAYKGWQYLETEVMDVEDPDAEEAWFYFKNDGMVYAKDEDGDYKVTYIDGKYYRFNELGMMTTGWKSAGIASGVNGIASGANPENYADSNGAMSKGWVKYTNDDGDSNWYYMVTVRTNDKETAYQAVPFNEGGDYYRAKTIGNDTFVFDTDGKMVTGLQDLTGAVNSDGELAPEDEHTYDGAGGTHKDAGIYYFLKDGSNEGAMVTNKKITLSDDGEESSYYFTKTGAAAVNGYYDKKIYDKDGVMLQAKDGNKYDFFSIPEEAPVREYNKYGVVKNADGTDKIAIAGGSEIIVDSNGKLVTKSATIEGVKYIVSVEDGVYTYAPEEE